VAVGAGVVGAVGAGVGAAIGVEAAHPHASGAPAGDPEGESNPNTDPGCSRGGGHQTRAHYTFPSPARTAFSESRMTHITAHASPAAGTFTKPQHRVVVNAPDRTS
jgi:hypothetical protein